MCEVFKDLVCQKLNLSQDDAQICLQILLKTFPWTFFFYIQNLTARILTPFIRSDYPTVKKTTVVFLKS